MLVTLQGEKIDQWTSSAHSQLHTWIKSGFSRPKSLYVVSCHHFETALLVTISLLDRGFLVTWQEIGNLDTIKLLSPPPKLFTQIRQWTRFPIQQVFFTRGGLPLKVAKVQTMFVQLTLCTLRSVCIISILFSSPFQRSWEFVKLSKSNNGPNLLVAPNLPSEKKMLHVPLLQSRCQSVPNWGKLFYIFLSAIKRRIKPLRWIWRWIV